MAHVDDLKVTLECEIFYFIKSNNKINGTCKEEKVYYKISQHS